MHDGKINAALPHRCLQRNKFIMSIRHISSIMFLLSQIPKTFDYTIKYKGIAKKKWLN